MATVIETAAMRSAIALSALGVGTTSPNPPVGCVILDSSQQVVGQGYHHRKGEPHAEALALDEAGARARGGTAVVTLEPCNHHGRAPACHAALIEAGISRVVIALIDPTSRGAGGAAKLHAADVDVEVGLLSGEAELVLGPWMRTLHTRRPVLWWAISHGASKSDVLQLSGLHSRADVIIHADGRITEAVPNSHGAGILALPEAHTPHRPEATVQALFDGGARTVLLEADQDRAEPFLQRGLIDHVAVVLTEESPVIRRKASIVPDGFSLDRVTKEGTAVLVEATRVRTEGTLPSPSVPRARFDR